MQDLFYFFKYRAGSLGHISVILYRYILDDPPPKKKKPQIKPRSWVFRVDRAWIQIDWFHMLTTA